MPPRGETHRIQDLLDKLIGLAKVPIEVTTKIDANRKADTAVTRADNRKLKSTTGWTPKIGIEQSLKEILNSWRSASLSSAGANVWIRQKVIAELSQLIGLPLTAARRAADMRTLQFGTLQTISLWFRGRVRITHSMSLLSKDQMELSQDARIFVNRWSAAWISMQQIGTTKSHPTSRIVFLINGWRNVNPPQRQLLWTAMRAEAHRSFSTKRIALKLS